MFIFTFFLYLIFFNYCASQSYNSCKKSEHHGQVILQCKEQGWKTLPPKEPLPADVTIIQLLKNQIEFIDPKSLESKKLKILDLSENKIRSLSSNTFHGLPLLEAIYLANNSLTEFPEDIFNRNEYLRVIEISRNFIKALPVTLFSRTKRLLSLNVSKNSLTDLGSFIFQHSPQLSMLDLSYNKFTSLGDNALDGAENLRILSLSGNKLVELPPRFSEQVPNIYVLNIDHNKLKTFPWFDFVKKSNRRLIRFNLHGNQITNVPRAFISSLQILEFQIGRNPLICDCDLDWIRSKEWYRIKFSKSDVNAHRLQFHQPDKPTVKCAGPGIYTGGHPWEFDTLCDVNECLSETPKCSSHSTCINTAGSYECKCHKGLFGSGKGKCMDVNECVLHGIHGIDMNCNLSISRCINTYGSYKCRCAEGYYNDNEHSCADIDECQTDLAQCPLMSTCINTKGSFRCECLKGYHVVKGKCEDINECESDNHGCIKKCYNTVGSYFCDCVKGFRYELDGECHDIDECESSLCHEFGKCTNLIGSYKCRCMMGYIGDGKNKCEDVDECSIGVHKCHKNATCRNTLGSHVCRCKEGYQGDGVKGCLSEDDIKREKFLRATPSPIISSPSSTAAIILGILVGILCLALIGGFVYVKKTSLTTKSKHQYYGIQAERKSEDLIPGE